MDGQTATEIRKQWAALEARLGCELTTLTNGAFVVNYRGRQLRTGIVDDPYIQERAMRAAIALLRDEGGE